MEQFVAVAVAHFLALLIPGVDFFLIVRTAMTGGWRNATGVCLGIACANGFFIVVAFSGLSLISHPIVLNLIQLAGGGFLIFIGGVFLRSRATVFVDEEPVAGSVTWLRNFGLGITSGLLNPKNALFYMSLAAAIHSDDTTALVLYGAWMFSVLLLWDIFVAVVFGSHQALHLLKRVLPWISVVSGGFLILFGVGMILRLAFSAFQLPITVF